MIQPVLTGDAFLQDVEEARQVTDAFHLWWLGQSGYLVQWQGRHLLIDPYLSDSLTEKYARTDKPHVRMTALVVEPEKLDFIDAITSSHNHTDHLDPDTLTPLMAANPNVKLIVPEANRQFAAERLGVHPGVLTGADDGITVTAAGFTFTGVAAAHENLEQDEEGRHRFLGYIIQFGPWTLYHSGDTVRYDGLVERLQRWPIDVAILPINGRAPERRVAGNLNGPEAARLAKEAGAHLAIPCHYEMFEFNTASPDEFVAEASRLGQPYQLLRAGERWSKRA
jgi:L-ascorbate metabolism protein UlaG (beta-lactamase superfamily)